MATAVMFPVHDTLTSAILTMPNDDDESMTASQILTPVYMATSGPVATPAIVATPTNPIRHETSSSEHLHWEDDQRRALGTSFQRTLAELDTITPVPIRQDERPKESTSKSTAKTGFHPLMLNMLSKEEVEAQEKQARKEAAAKQVPLKRSVIWDWIQRWMPKFLLLEMKPRQDQPTRSSSQQSRKNGNQFMPSFSFKAPTFQNPFRPSVRTTNQLKGRGSILLKKQHEQQTSQRFPSWFPKFGKKEQSMQDTQTQALQQAHALRDL